ncbi:MAG: hypothetical protein ACLRFL_02885 [Clostridia bacterium]
MNSAKIKNLNIKYDQNYYSINDASELLKRRDISLLTKKWFMIKMRNGELISLYDGMRHLFIHIDRHDSMYGIQFYNSYGDIIMTYPWNGVMSGFNEGQLVNDYKERFGNTEDSMLTTIDVIFRNGEIVICDEVREFRYLSNIDDKHREIRSFTYGGQEKNMYLSLSGRKNYDRQVDLILNTNSYDVDAELIAKNNDTENIINY